MRLLLVVLTLLLSSAASASSPFDDWSPEALWEAWPDGRFIRTEAQCLAPKSLESDIEQLQKSHEGRLEVEILGHSVEGRPIRLLRLGSGKRRVLLWSQMHGDEPSATPALLDLAHALLSSSSEQSRSILSELELLMVPMLNPDGVVRWSRRNAYGIDLNRDALTLATPEARLLKTLRDDTEPMLGYNLHDQGRRILAGDTGELATLSFLGVAGDEEGTLTPGRERAMRAASAMVDATRWHLGEAIGRYDEDWNPRAFGDNVTRWGTPVVLLESGGLAPDRPVTELTRLNFVALAHSLAELARNDLGDHDIDTYRSLPRNRRGGYSDLMVRGGDLWHPGSSTRFRADLAVDVYRMDLDPEECAERIAGPDRGRKSTIVEIGDGSQRIGGRTIDAGGQLLIGAFRVHATGRRSEQELRTELREMAEHGVGWVTWQISRNELEATEQLVRTVGALGLPRVSVTTEKERTAQELRWYGASGREVSKLRDVADAFRVPLKSLLTMAQPIEHGRAASFFVVHDDGDGAPAPSSRLGEVVLDGAPASN